MPVYSALTPTVVADSGPTGWPQSWTWPPAAAGPWPPSWEQEPDATDDKVTVTAPSTLTSGSEITLVADTVTTADADTSAYSGEIIKVTVSAATSGALTLKASSGDSYTSAIYVDVTNYTGAKYGFSQSVWVSASGAEGEVLTFTCEVWGFDPDVIGTDTSTANVLAQVGTVAAAEMSGSYATSMHSSGNDLYLTTNAGDFYIMDKTTIATITAHGSVALPSAATGASDGVYGSGSYVYCNYTSTGPTTRKLIAIDISTKSSPSAGNTATYVAADADCGRLVAVGTDLFCCGGTNVYTMDISTPGTPSFGAGISDANFAGCMHASDVDSNSHIYIPSPTTHSVSSVDITTPGSMTISDTLTDATNLASIAQVVVSGNYLYGLISGKLTIVDITNPASLSVVGTVTDANISANSTFLMITTSGSYVYILDRTGAFSVLAYDISTPTSPTLSQGLSVTDTTSIFTHSYIDSSNLFSNSKASDGYQVLAFSHP